LKLVRAENAQRSQKKEAQKSSKTVL